MYFIKKNNKYLVKDYNRVTNKYSYYYATKNDIRSINSYNTHKVKIIKTLFKNKALDYAEKYYGELERGFFK